jgi:hypothetical protein
MKSKHEVVDKAASIHTAEGFFNAYRKEISTIWLLTVIQKSFGMSLLETKSKVRLIKHAE